jgi:hypothetical protein
MGAEHLRGTLFDEGFSEAMKDLAKKPVNGLSVGSYTLPLLWVDALKVKLRLDWVEPAHFRKPAFAEYRQRRIVWEAHEPVHWFHPGARLAPAEAVLITVLDEVYPELGLANQIAAMKRGTRYQVGPGVREPVHFGRFVGPEVLEPAHWHVGPGVREPAHFRPFERFESPEAAVELIQQLATMLRRYGF